MILENVFCIAFGVLIICFNLIQPISDQLSENCEYFEHIRDQAVAELQSHCQSSKPEDNSRFSKLLLRLSPLRSLQPDVLEEIFFAGLIGNVQIETVIPFALTMDTADHKLTI